MKKNMIFVMILMLALGVLSSCSGPEAAYKQAQNMLAQGEYAKAAEKFGTLGSYEDAAMLTMYCKACAMCEEGNFEAGIEALEALGDYKDSAYRISYYKARSWDERSAGTTELEWMETAVAIYSENRLYLDSAERIDALAARIGTTKKMIYDDAVANVGKGQYHIAKMLFERIRDYQDSAEQIAACEIAILDDKYDAAVALMNEERYEDAIAAFAALHGYRDSAEQIAACEFAIRYAAAVALMNEERYEDAIEAFAALHGYRDSESKVLAMHRAVYFSPPFDMMEYDFTAFGLTFEGPANWGVDNTEPDRFVLVNGPNTWIALAVQEDADGCGTEEMKEYLAGVVECVALRDNVAQMTQSLTASRPLLDAPGCYCNYHVTLTDGTRLAGRAHVANVDGTLLLVQYECPIDERDYYQDTVYGRICVSIAKE